MDYNHIKDYLNKFKELLFSKEEVYRIISSVIERNVLIKIEQKYIKTNGNTILIKASPLILNEILIKKEKILKEISQVYTETSFKNIR